MTAFGFGPAFRLHRGGVAGVAGPGFDFTGGSLPAGASLTRSGVATRTNAAGAIVGEAANVARFDYAGGVLRGLLIEPARSNFALRSANLDDAAWNRTGLGVTADAATAPDGATAAELLAPTGSNGRQYQPVYLPSSGLSCVASLYARAAGSGGAFGIAATNAAGSTLLVSASFTATAGWQRFALPAVTAPDASVLAFVGGAGTFNSPDAIHGWGYQLEVIGAGERAGPSSYIATTSASASRAADALTLDWGAQGVADGAITARFTFDDGSTQDVAATVAGGVADVPTNLARAWLRRAEKV